MQIPRTHLKTPPSRVRRDFLASARREEEVVTPVLRRRRATTRGKKIARTQRDTANSGDSVVAPPRSTSADTPSSSLLGLAGIGSYRGGRSFEMGSRRKSDLLRKRDSGPVYLTEEGLRAMREELAHLKRVLPARIAETARTAAYGDRSDNAEYKDAKGTLRRTHWRILDIEEQLKRVVVIVSGPNSSGTVQLGSTVVLETGGAEKTFYIVGPLETDPGLGRISHLSPLGAALIGHAKGEEVTIATRGGAKIYRILEIK